MPHYRQQLQFLRFKRCRRPRHSAIYKYIKAMETSGIAPKVFENMVSKYHKLLPKFNEVIDMSFLDDEDKEMYKQGIASRLARVI